MLSTITFHISVFNYETRKSTKLTAISQLTREQKEEPTYDNNVLRLFYTLQKLYYANCYFNHKR